MFLEVLADLVDTSAPPECQASVVVPGDVLRLETSLFNVCEVLVA